MACRRYGTRGAVGQALVRGDQGRSPLVPPGDQLVEGRPEARGSRQVAQLVKDQHLAAEERTEQALPPDPRGGTAKLVGEVLGGDEGSGGAQLDVFGRDADRQHHPSQTRRADQRQRPRLLDEGRVRVVSAKGA
jgi:hypothetical protein